MGLSSILTGARNAHMHVIFMWSLYVQESVQTTTDNNVTIVDISENA